MEYLKNLIIFLILAVFLSGCAGQQHITHEVVKPDGSPFPDPFYVIQTVDRRTPVRLSFFYSSIKAVKDLDGRVVPEVQFLDRNTHHLFLSEDEQSVKLVARILNPRNIKYKVFCRRSVRFHGGGTMDSMTLVAYSDMKYREFIRELPTNEEVKEVTYSFEVTDFAENPLLRTGQFHYYIQ
jgi:hypothetical protein